MEAPPTGSIAPAEFRRALAHYPTGVALVASREADGTPVGMVVGTFTSVSLEPPLVSFLPDRTSTSWPRIRKAGRFCVSVLGAGQEQVCRSFFTKEAGRFQHHCGSDAPSGSPRVDQAVLWVDCDIESVVEAGDHDIVLGRVRDIEVPASPVLPLLFLRGGYGAPAPLSLQARSSEPGVRLRLADAVRPEAEAIARDLNLECLVSAAVDDHVVSLVAAGVGVSPQGSPTRVGAAFPLAAPFGPLFVAWASPAEQDAWITRSGHLAGEQGGRTAREDLAAVRALGYQVTTGHATADRFERLVENGALDTGDAKDLLRRLVDRGPEPGLRTALHELTEVTSLAVPVRTADGTVALSLHLIGFTGDESPDRLPACRDRLLAGAERARELISS
ncbi:flavin reductase [Streptomyces sp. NPDC003247]|uniref:flavin reductase n=1 Tax=Streptomyces sp. NPDC003247 TaxID=3364677 RepID=UPI0036963CDE